MPRTQTCLSLYKQIRISTDFNKVSNTKFCWPDSVVGRATRYARNSPGIASRWGARISLNLQTCPRVQPASYTMGNRAIFQGQIGRGMALTTHTQLVRRLKKVELHLYTVSVLSRRVTVWTFYFQLLLSNFSQICQWKASWFIFCRTYSHDTHCYFSRLYTNAQKMCPTV